MIVSQSVASTHISHYGVGKHTRFSKEPCFLFKVLFATRPLGLLKFPFSQLHWHQIRAIILFVIIASIVCFKQGITVHSVNQTVELWHSRRRNIILTEAHPVLHATLQRIMCNKVGLSQPSRLHSGVKSHAISRSKFEPFTSHNLGLPHKTHTIF